MTATKPTDLITVTRLEYTFKASRRTVAHLDFTAQKFREVFPHAELTIIQTCYNSGVAASAGTHDFDACLDFGWTGKLPGLTLAAKWRRFQRFMRAHGWGCWWRHTGPWAARSEWHVHGFTLPANLATFATRVGEFVDGGLSEDGRVIASSQLVDYLGHAEGLAGEHVKGVDKTWYPKPIRATVFDYDGWVKVHPWPRDRATKTATKTVAKTTAKPAPARKPSAK